MAKIIKPRDDLIERVAGEMAAEWFEAGLNTPGMNMLRHKYKNNPRLYAQQNIEKFIPVAIKTLMDMLKPTSNCSAEMREEIYDALMDRVNEKGNITSTDIQGLSDIDVKKLMELSSTPEEKAAQLLNPDPPKPLVIHNPGKAARH